MRTEMLERLKAVAESTTLVEVNFLNSRGDLIKRNQRWEPLEVPVFVEMTFTGGQLFRISMQEFDALGDFKFNVGSTLQ